MVRKKPAINHQPPSCKGGKLMPYSGFGGSSESQGNCRTNSIGLQFTEAIMLRPIISIATMPQTIEASPKNPR